MKRKPALWTLAYPEQVRHPVKKGSNRFWKRPGQKPIKKRSTRMEARMKLYRAAARQFLKEHPLCEAKWKLDVARYRCNMMYQPYASTSVHHVKGRAGPLLLDQRHWMAVCQNCHITIHAHPNWAEHCGNLDPSGWRHVTK